MPPIPAISTAVVMRAAAAIASFVAVGLGIMAGTNVVGFTNDYYNSPTETPLPPTGNFMSVDFGPNAGSESCPTCLFVDSNNVLLDYYGRPIDVERLMYNTPTQIPPLKISHADPVNPHPKQATTPPPPEREVYSFSETMSTTPASSEPTIPLPDPSKLEIILDWLESLLSWRFLRLEMPFNLTVGPMISDPVMQRLWRIFWLVASRLASSIIFKFATAWIRRLLKNRVAQQAKLADEAIDESDDGEVRQSAVGDEGSEKPSDLSEEKEETIGVRVHEFQANGSEYTMSGILQDDDHVNQEDEGHAWPIGFFNYQPPWMRYMNVEAEEVDHDELACTKFRAPQIYDKPEKELLKKTRHALVWLEWQIAYLGLGYGTPEDPHAKLNPRPTSATPTDESSEAAVARQAREADLVVWRKNQISRHKSKAAELRVMEAELRVIERKLKAGILISYAIEDEVKDASEQSRRDVPQDDDVQSLGEEKVEDTNSIEGTNEQGEENGSFLHPNRRTKLTLCADGLAKPEPASTDIIEEDQDTALARKLQEKYNILLDAEDELRWHERQIDYLEKGHGTPEDPDAKSNPPPTPATIDEETDDAAIARRFHKEELTGWRKERIRLHEEKLSALQEKIASFSANIDDGSGSANCEADSESSQAPPGDDLASPLQADPQPEAGEAAES